VDTTTVSSSIETIDVRDEEDNAKSSGAMTTPSAGTPRKAASIKEHAMVMPRWTSIMEERPRSSTNAVGDPGSQKRAKKAPPNPYKPGLLSATK
jgi:hypothetical protein